MIVEENHLRVVINHRLQVVLIEEIDDEDRVVNQLMLSFDDINLIWEKISMEQDLTKSKGERYV